MFPPISDWDALHPLVIHFPIGLLMVAPLLVLLSLLFPACGRAYSFSAFVIMLLGTAGAIVSVATGKASLASGVVDTTVKGLSEVLERHKELAEMARNAFAALTVLYAVVVWGPMLIKKNFGRATHIIVTLVYLAVYSGAMLLLVNAAHNGGRLVHEFGVHVLMGAT